MKKIQVNYMGRKLCQVYPHATKFQVFKYRVRMFFRKVFITGFVLAILFLAIQIGANMFPNVIYAVREVKVPVDTQAEVMNRIAKCESSGMHLRDGQVVLNGNKNGTADIGKYQINTVWNKKATELGYNLATEEGNTKMAYWIYNNKGTEPWYSTKACWSK